MQIYDDKDFTFRVREAEAEEAKVKGEWKNIIRLA